MSQQLLDQIQISFLWLARLRWPFSGGGRGTRLRDLPKCTRGNIVWREKPAAHISSIMHFMNAQRLIQKHSAGFHRDKWLKRLCKLFFLSLWVCVCVLACGGVPTNDACDQMIVAVRLFYFWTFIVKIQFKLLLLLYFLESFKVSWVWTFFCIHQFSLRVARCFTNLFTELNKCPVNKTPNKNHLETLVF